jgi:dUTP pyrophosphatase
MIEDNHAHQQTPLLSRLLVKKLNPSAILPKKGSSGAAGYDICANEDVVVPARGKAKVPTGLAWTCPPNTYGRIAPRSGLAWKNSINVGAGVIDEDYRGEVCVILFNHGDVDLNVKYPHCELGRTTESPR